MYSTSLYVIDKFSHWLSKDIFDDDDDGDGDGDGDGDDDGDDDDDHDHDTSND